MRSHHNISTYFSSSGSCYRYLNQHLQSTPLVLVHGVGLNLEVWQPQIDYFAATRPLLVYDLLGHGNSPLPPENPQLSEYVAQLDELIAHLGIQQFHLLGHSMGALISTAYALDNPASLCSLSALNMVYQRSDEQRRQVQERAAEVLANGKIKGVEAALERWFPSQEEPASREKMQLIRQWMGLLDPTGYGRTYAIFASGDRAFDGRLQSLSMPSLFLTGSFDPNSTPEMSQSLAADAAHGVCEVLDGEAHMMAFANPSRVNPVIDAFIQQYGG